MRLGKSVGISSLMGALLILTFCYTSYSYHARLVCGIVWIFSII